MTITQRAKRITDAYAAAVPLCKWPAINNIVIKAIKTELYGDDEIRDALLRLAADGRPVTIDTLRVEIEGLPPPQRNDARPSTTDRAVANAQAVKAKLRTRFQEQT